ncbi:MAG: hypothetical protein QGG25_17910 [Phycisphaerae bacterium]|jgi:hypothetical protein|nr:hypothetical protein [Phycisphaerae bacterium]|tara:strand:+ start:474 stop:695 length:222 start_codon:yes stop_codon:yes gene_type:complete
MIAELFVHPLIVPFHMTLLLLPPLCVLVAIVYKTVRVHDLRMMPKQAGILIIYMLAGLTALGAGLWAIHEFMP